MHQVDKKLNSTRRKLSPPRTRKDNKIDDKSTSKSNKNWSLSNTNKDGNYKSSQTTHVKTNEAAIIEKS